MPTGVVGFTEYGTPDVEYVLCTGNPPEHARLFGSFADDGFASCFDHT